MFTDRFNYILRELQLQVGRLAGYAGLDRTNISRFKSGSRIPRPEGNTTSKLVHGIVLYVKDMDSRPEAAGTPVRAFRSFGTGTSAKPYARLCQILSCPADLPAERVEAKLREYLHESPSSAPVTLPTTDPAKAHSSFGEHLTISMDLANLTNSQLSRLMHIDASAISRYRSNQRKPLNQTNPVVADQLCTILWDNIVKNGHRQELSQIIMLPAEELNKHTYRQWLYHEEWQINQNIQAAEKLLQAFNSIAWKSEDREMSQEGAHPSEQAAAGYPDNLIAANDHDGSDAVYYGTAGLQRAVLRFLTSSLNDHCRELYLYSDEDMSWMITDQSFHQQWAYFMKACVEHGIHIHIIHNIDRNLGEMCDAITSWLPLYLSGMVESYYCKRANGSRFAHTLFLAPGTACISAFRVQGAGAEGLYHYDTDPESIAYMQANFNALLRSSLPLMKINPTPYPNRKTTTIIRIQNVPSLATMPKELVDMYHLPELTTEWTLQQHQLEKCLSYGEIYEYVAELTPDSPDSYPVYAEYGPALSPLPYSEEAYHAHIAHMQKLARETRNYHYIPLPSLPFPHMNLLITNQLVRITNIHMPELSLGFIHPLMCRAFLEYANHLNI